MNGLEGMALADLGPELALLVGAIATLLFALFAPRAHQKWSAAVAILAISVGAVLATAQLTGAAHLTFAGSYAIDAMTRWGTLIVLGVTGVVVVLSLDWFASDARQGEFYALLLFSALGAVLLAGAADLMEIILAVLLSSATGYVLVAYHRRSKRAGEAAIKYYLLGALTNALLVLGAVLLFGVGASTTLAVLRATLAESDPRPLIIGTTLVVMGLVFKLGAVPVHAWVPDVADAAPAPVSVFVTIAPKVGALIALARVVSILPSSLIGWRPLIAVLAALTMTLGNLAALWQDDVRRLLGWSAVSQSGYALMALVALGRSPLALPSLLYFLTAYALANLAAFAVVISLRGESTRARYSGLASVHPLLASVLVVSFLSFVGIPPLAGFTGKLALFGAAIDAGYGWLAWLAAANSVLSLAYYARVLGPAYFPQGTPISSGASTDSETMNATSHGHSTRDNARAATAAVLCASAVIVLGVFAELFLRSLREVRLLPG